MTVAMCLACAWLLAAIGRAVVVRGAPGRRRLLLSALLTLAYAALAAAALSAVAIWAWSS